jgi:hypothetical protein
MSFIYRANLISNLFAIRDWVSFGVFTINNKVRNYVNLSVKLFDILSVRSSLFVMLLLLDLYYRLKYGVIYFNIPRYMYANWRFFYFYMHLPPKKRDLAYPTWNINLFRGSDFLTIFSGDR